MRNSFLILLLLLLPKLSFCQDTTRILYTQELDTLVKQRFIDRYENVFMTKVQTRHMFKIGLSQYYQALNYSLMDDELIFNNVSLNLGYEFKFLPSFSVAVSTHSPIFNLAGNPQKSLDLMIFDGQLRWFFNMRKRVKAKKAASNFSGNYVALSYNVPGLRDFKPRAGIKLGFQRRFLNSGFMDFAFALQKQDLTGEIYKNWSFSSQASFGFALGDWKKSDVGPLCDILLCDEQATKQWKLLLPELTFGNDFNRIRLSVAYEQKIKASPFTVNFQFDIAANQGYNKLSSTRIAYGDGRNYLFHSREFLPTVSVQPRYYLLHKREQRRGKGGNGFSGIYAGINSEYTYYFGDHRYPESRESYLLYKKHIIRGGLLFGFQQRLFRHGYLDLNTSYNFQNQSPMWTGHTGLKANLGIGLAL